MNQPGDRVTVKEITPPVYPLRDGLKGGDVVKLLAFDCGYWSVERESDRQCSEIYLANIDLTLARHGASETKRWAALQIHDPARMVSRIKR